MFCQTSAFRGTSKSIPSASFLAVVIIPRLTGGHGSPAVSIDYREFVWFVVCMCVCVWEGGV